MEYSQTWNIIWNIIWNTLRLGVKTKVKFVDDEDKYLAAKRRSWQRREEHRMRLVTTSGQEIVRRGRVWGR